MFGECKKFDYIVGVLYDSRTHNSRININMKKIVFYSWQSDLPNSSNRGFIQKALEGATTDISFDDSIEVKPVVDRDTQGVAGAPDIAVTIFSKIDAADVFVADVSIAIKPDTGRVTPNPNVLIELGYAIKTLGYQRVILVFNQAFGKLGDLPFDLRTRRSLIYDMPEESKQRSEERNKLQKSLHTALLSALSHTPDKNKEIISSSITAIEENKPQKIISLRKDLNNILDDLDKIQPIMCRDGGSAEDLIEGVKNTKNIVEHYSKIVETISVMDDIECAIQVVRWFGKIFERYNPKPNINNKTTNADGDFFKIIGHEMFVILVGFLLKEKRWSTLSKILKEPIGVKDYKRGEKTISVYWNYASNYSPLLYDASKQSNRVSLHADILNNRHTNGNLASILPMQEFINADYFLYLKKNPSLNTGFEKTWFPISLIYLNDVPTFIRDAEKIKTAQDIIQILNIPDIENFKTSLEKIPENVAGHYMFWPINKEDIDKVGIVKY